MVGGNDAGGASEGAERGASQTRVREIESDDIRRIVAPSEIFRRVLTPPVVDLSSPRASHNDARARDVSLRAGMPTRSRDRVP